MTRVYSIWWLALVSPALACSASDDPSTSRGIGHVGEGDGDGPPSGDGDDPAGGGGPLCGDGALDPGEDCDDGNRSSKDGCSASCRSELDCSTGTCVSECGDGLVFDEACDDGNVRDGDGCSHDCEVEAGFTCVTGGDCDALDGPCTIRVPVTFRDFKPEHPDFEVGCGSLVQGVVEESLNDMGKPVLKNGGPACIESKTTFAEWYTDGPNNRPISGEIRTLPDGERDLRESLWTARRALEGRPGTARV
ncbi:MAG: DUF4215 domain-containing protein [Myxococcales bacterium]